jgi:hypothetical protein
MAKEIANFAPIPLVPVFVGFCHTETAGRGLNHGIQGGKMTETG